MGIMVCYVEPVAGNHGVNAVPVGMIHGELCYSSGVNHGESCCTSGCESCCVMLSHWL